MSRTLVFGYHVQFRADRKSETGEKQSKEHAHNFLCHREDCSQRIRPVKPVNSAYYCDSLQRLLQNVRKLRSELWEKIWQLHHDNALSHISFLTREFFTKNNISVFLTHPTRLIWAPEIFLSFLD
jgi:hypothetical protein